MPEYECEPFGIDGDELDGLSPQQCFVIGFEFAIVHKSMMRQGLYSMPIHPENVDRIRKAAAKRGIDIEIKAYDDNWFHLNILHIPEPPPEEPTDAR